MTIDQKTAMVMRMTDNAYDESMVAAYLESAEGVIMQRAYPFGNAPEDGNVPMQYERTQIDVAVYLLNKRGAEGETVHNENGVNRSYESAGVPESMLRNIMPHARVFGGGV